MCMKCFASLIATYFVVYFALVAITNPIWDVWIYSLIITVLAAVAFMFCHKEGCKCFALSKPSPVKAPKKKR